MYIFIEIWSIILLWLNFQVTEIYVHEYLFIVLTKAKGHKLTKNHKILGILITGVNDLQGPIWK